VRLYLILLFLILISCKGEKKYHDEIKPRMVADQTNAITDILAFQKKLNEEFKDPETSPLADRHRKNFEGLDFFEPDTSLIVMANFQRTPHALPFDMPTTTDRMSREVVYGIAKFNFRGI